MECEDTEANAMKEAQETLRHYNTEFSIGQAACSKSLDSEQMYQRMEDYALCYGAAF